MASYRFGTIEVRPAERRVLVSGAAAAVGARAFDLLVALIENRDRVMTKDELLALVWPGLVVEENNLQVQVSTLRKIMGGEAIATLPGRGYRFTLAPDDGAVAATPASRRHNLPGELDSFVGREDELAAAARLLAESRLVTLIGAGGTGKTRLSLRVAAAAAGQFPDGAWLVELASISDDRHVALAVAAAMGIAEADLDAHAAARSLLVVLDNCEHLSRACAEAARRLLQAGTGVRILATSREPLHLPGEVTYRVQPLARAQAIELFVDRARAAKPDFEPELDSSHAVAEICRRLDGMPLAIELAAARVRALSVVKIAERLDDRFRLLTGGDSTAVPHQQTLRASIDWSYELLSAPERLLMRRLSVFAGGWTLESAEAVAGGGEIEQASSIVGLLSGLVEKSLVTADGEGMRYHMLETVREYSLEHLVESGEAAAIRERHLQHYIAFASRAREELVGPGQAAWYRRVDIERDNILAAFRWCGPRAERAELQLRLMSSLKMYWLNRGLVGLVRGAVLDALRWLPERGRQRARALYDAGQMGYFMGLFGDARRELEECLGIARETGDQELIGLALQPLGLACAGVGDTAAARPYLEEAIEIARAQQEPRRVAARVNALAQLYRVEGDFAAAEPLYEHVIELSRGLGDHQSEAIGLLNLAMTAADRGDLARACRALEEVLARSPGASKPVAQSVLEVCAGLASIAQDWEHAARFYGAAEAEAARTGIRRDPADEAFLSPRIDAVRAALGSDAFPASEAQGRVLDCDAALEEVLAWLRQAATH
jgi:non-specific serine/threonine protein kinase